MHSDRFIPLGKWLATFACVFGIAMGGSARAQTYNAVKDFSLKSNPNGVWSYGTLSAVTGGSFAPFTTATANSQFTGQLTWCTGESIPYSASNVLNASGTSVTVSVTVVLPINQVNIDGEDLIADLRFTAPATGAYKLTGLFQRTDIYANPVNVYVVKNGTQILFSATDLTGYESRATFNDLGDIDLTAGSTVDFVESASQYNNDSTGVEANIVLVSPPTVQYTFLLSATDTSSGVPQGAGYGTLTVGPKGGVIMAGRLPDGERFRTSGSLVSGTAGSGFMVYDTLRYRFLKDRRERGLLVGSLTFEKLDGSDFTGTLEWAKPRQSMGKYKEAIDTNLNVIGSIYTPPRGAGSVLPGFTTGMLALSDTGGLSVAGPTPLIETVTLDSGNALTIPNPDTDKLKVTISPATGVFKGSFVYPAQTMPTEFSGVLFQDQINGGGFFLGPYGSGRVSLMPAP